MNDSDIEEEFNFLHDWILTDEMDASTRITTLNRRVDALVHLVEALLVRNKKRVAEIGELRRELELVTMQTEQFLDPRRRPTVTFAGDPF